jgi:hypothetical protein
MTRPLQEIDRELAVVRARMYEIDPGLALAAREVMDLLIERAHATGETDKPLHYQLQQHLEAVIAGDL